MQDILDRIGSATGTGTGSTTTTTTGTGTGLPVLVMEGGHLAGIITVHDTTRLVRRHTLGPAPGSARG